MYFWPCALQLYDLINIKSNSSHNLRSTSELLLHHPRAKMITTIKSQIIFSSHLHRFINEESYFNFNVGPQLSGKTKSIFLLQRLLQN